MQGERGERDGKEAGKIKNEREVAEGESVQVVE